MRYAGERDYRHQKDDKSNEALEEEFIEAAKSRDKARKDVFISLQNDINNEYKQFRKHSNSYGGKCLQHDNDSKLYLSCTNNDGKFDFRNDDLTFSNYSNNVNDLNFSKTMYHFGNNEQLVETKDPKISSLIINLPICNTENPYLNNRLQKLKQIAYSMESIIKFQRDVLKKDRILFRDEEKQEMELLTMKQFRDRITDLCRKHNAECKKEEEKIDMNKVKYPHGRWCRFKKWFKNLFSLNYHVNNNANASYDTDVIKNDMDTLMYSNM